MLLHGEPWDWTSWSVSFAHDWSRTYTRTDTGLDIVDDFGERFGTLAYTLKQVDEAGCTALFETSPPPRDWPLWNREPAAAVAPAPPETVPN